MNFNSFCIVQVFMFLQSIKQSLILITPNALLAVPGYQHQRFDRTCNRGRVSLYIRDSLACKLRSDIHIDDLELIYVEI